MHQTTECLCKFDRSSWIIEKDPWGQAVRKPWLTKNKKQNLSETIKCFDSEHQDVNFLSFNPSNSFVSCFSCFNHNILQNKNRISFSKKQTSQLNAIIQIPHWKNFELAILLPTKQTKICKIIHSDQEEQHAC